MESSSTPLEILQSSLRGARPHHTVVESSFALAAITALDPSSHQFHNDSSEAFSGEYSFSSDNDDPDLIAVITADTAPMRPSRRVSVEDPAMHLRPAIVTFGDSLTQEGYGVDGGTGWISMLQASYARRADVLPRGFSGYNTQHAVDVLGRVLGRLPMPILFTTVWFGANDAVEEGGPQYVSPADYEDNLENILSRMRRILKPMPRVAMVQSGGASKCNGMNKNTGYDAYPILLLTPPPIQEEMWCEWRGITFSDRSNDRARLYGNVLKRVAANTQDSQVAVVDVWELLDGEFDTRAQYLSDGLHLNAAGNRKVYEGIVDCLRQHFPHVLPMVDGNGKYGTKGIPVEEKLWQELVDVPLPPSPS